MLKSIAKGIVSIYAAILLVAVCSILFLAAVVNILIATVS